MYVWSASRRVWKVPAVVCQGVTASGATTEGLTGGAVTRWVLLKDHFY